MSYNIKLSDHNISIGVGAARAAGAVISSNIYFIFRLIIPIILILIQFGFFIRIPITIIFKALLTVLAGINMVGIIITYQVMVV